MALNRVALRPIGPRATLLALSASRTPRLGLRHSSTAPATVVDGSFWRSLVPKPLRKENRELRKKKARAWNPATFFIVMFLLIGSMSIQMIALRNSFDRYMRQSENKLGILRGVVERIQNGEDVDVEKALGTGDAQKEADWEEMLRAIERDDISKDKKKKEEVKKSEVKAQVAALPKVEEQETESEQPPPKRKTSSLGNFF